MAILSASMTAGHEGLKSVPIDDIPMPAMLALVWRKGENPVVRELLAECREAFG